MHDQRPDVDALLSRLKDFQRRTVDYVFRRMYLDEDFARRFLVADEVGLGKTLVARGVIAKAIDRLWDRTGRIDVVYICSSSDIARQNIQRLNVTGRDDFSLASRITLLPIDSQRGERGRVNFVSFTPGTSFEQTANAGLSTERELLYWLLAEAWTLNSAKATCVLRGDAGVDGFRDRVRSFNQRHQIHPGMAESFAGAVSRRPDLRERYDELAERMPRAGAAVPEEVGREAKRFIGELRKVLAQSCLRWLEPDLIILDEFQRFKHLLPTDDEDAGDAAQLAKQLFDYQEAADDPASAARVLLLSATPYKMYTLAREAEEDDHYADFRRTLGFLHGDAEQGEELHRAIAAYREGLFRLPQAGVEGLLSAKERLEASLKRVMVRTERLGLGADRNGMLVESPCEGAKLEASDVRQYLAVQRVANSLDHEDVLEYWKSAPYLLNFMDEYDLKRKLRRSVDDDEGQRDLARAVRNASDAMLDRERAEAYKAIDPANARMRALFVDTIDRDAWRLLWIPPSLPYYPGEGAFADERLVGYTKRLVFSCWKVVPKTIAAVLSYEAERRMVRAFRRKSRNTPEDRKRRRALLRFTFSKGRPTGMPALAAIYPSRTLAEEFDPLILGRAEDGSLVSRRQAVERIAAALLPRLSALADEFGDAAGPTDESWYWAAPILLDLTSNARFVKAWFEQPDLAEQWEFAAGGDDAEASSGWRRHVELARRFAQAPEGLGRLPDDLAETLALQSLAGPGVAALRALSRALSPGSLEDELAVTNAAGSLAYAFLHLFNLPEVTYLIRDRGDDEPYWRTVLKYCADGNLQSTLDEYVHLLNESLGLADEPVDIAAPRLALEVGRALTLRTSTVQADLLSAERGRVRFEDPLRMRTRFAMRFGVQEHEDASEATTADQVRSAFNSPFWPFVLATTSVGQEGLDFHPYCHAVVHWNLPSNPVDLEQREGRVHRYKGHALRKNLAASHAHAAVGARDPWQSIFETARSSRPAGENDLFPYWTCSDGPARIQRIMPCLPHSREVVRRSELGRSLVLYRMVFGQNRQEDLVRFLRANVDERGIEEVVERCRVDLSPPDEALSEAPSFVDDVGEAGETSQENQRIADAAAREDRKRGCLLGLAIGDALGAAVEFAPRGTFPPVVGYRDGGPHRLAPGEWTDDTSMALALSDSLAETGWSLDDQMRRYVAWWREGAYSVNGRCFDIGGTTRSALMRYAHTGDPLTSGDASPHASGNGSIMRLAPVPIRFAELFPDDLEQLSRLAAESSLLTHASPQCLSACRYMALVLAALIQGVPREDALSPKWEPLRRLREVEPLHPEVDAVAAGSFREKTATAVSGSGYVVESLEAALWAFHDAASFEEAVLLAVNLGDDADTTGAVCGQFAGAFWGERGIPQQLRDGLARRSTLSAALIGLGVASTPEAPSRDDADDDSPSGALCSNPSEASTQSL